MKCFRMLLKMTILFLFPALTLAAPLFGDKIEYPVGAGPFDICAADFNGDGADDLAVANHTYSSLVDVSVLINKGDGTFADVVSYSVGRNYIRSIVAADLNNDNDIDLAVARAGSTNNVLTLLNNGDGTFQLSKAYDAGDYAWSLCAYDLNNDSLVDLAAAFAISNEMSILLNNGDSTFTDTGRYPCGDWAACVTGGDFDGDSTIDLVVANAVTVGPGHVSVFINKGDGTYMDSVNYPAGEQPYSVITGDFDDDNNLDLAVADGDITGKIAILFGSDSAIFQTPVYYNVGQDARDVYAADLDNNNSLDLIAGMGTDNSVVVLLNNGDGTLTVEDSYPVGNYIYNVCSGDFDKDGDNDIAVAGYANGRAVILFNQTINHTDVSDDSEKNVISAGFSLSCNHPNPFNPTTTFEYRLPYRADIEISVYNLLGQKVKTLVKGEKSYGLHSVNWNGKDNNSHDVAAGIYFYQMKSADFVKTRKMVLLK